MFVEKQTNITKIFALNEISTVERRNHVAGALGGILMTLGSMAVEIPYASRKYGDGAYLVAATFCGGLIGTVVNGIIGKRESFIMMTDSVKRYQTMIAEIPDQLELKKVIKVGVEFGNALTTKRGPFSIAPGFTFGYLSGIPMHRASQGAYILGLEVAHTNLYDYSTHEMYYWHGYNKYKAVVSKKERFSFLDMGLLPEYMFLLGENTVGATYAGASIGIGWRELENVQRTESIVETSTTYVYPSYDLSAYPDGCTTGSLSAGVSMFYKRLMLDVRYKYSTISSADAYHNVYFQIGFVL
ncbi:MAG TPA: hypothetical protein VK141_05350 [Nitrosomonas sp.]|nr:hypothetical protein [Nitrosomonas sp.]